jgi:3-keto-disaccharide hydrolase
VSWYFSYAGSTKQRNSILFTIIAAIVFFTFLFGYLSSVFGNNSSVTENGSKNASQNTITPTVGITATTIGSKPTPTNTPIPTPTLPPSPTPSPTPPQPSPPKPGTVLYQADWSGGMNGWNGSDDWQPSNGTLTNNGQKGGSISLAPYSPGDHNIANYAIEAQIQFLRYSDAGNLGGLDSFGIIARSDGQNGYTFAYCASAGIASCGSNSHEMFISNGNQNIAEYAVDQPDTNWHTYRMEVNGNNIKVFIDGRLFLKGTDTTYSLGGQVGLFSNRSQIIAQSFKVIAL